MSRGSLVGLDLHRSAGFPPDDGRLDGLCALNLQLLSVAHALLNSRTNICTTTCREGGLWAGENFNNQAYRALMAIETFTSVRRGVRSRRSSNLRVLGTGRGSESRQV